MKNPVYPVAHTLCGRRPPFLSQSLVPGLVLLIGLIDFKSSQSIAKDREGPFWLLSSLRGQQAQVLCTLCIQRVCPLLAPQQHTVRFCSAAGPSLPSDAVLRTPGQLTHVLLGESSAFASLLTEGCWDYRCALLGSTFLYGLWGSDSGYRPWVASACPPKLSFNSLQ